MLYAVITIDDVDYTIPADDIKNTVKSEEKLALSALTYNITLDNIDKSKYDERITGSLFSSYNWYKARVRAYDANNNNKKVWDGLLTNIKTSDKELVLCTANYVRLMADTVCIVMDITGTLTPAHLMYAIMVDPLGLNIPADNINVYEFQAAMAYQAANNIFVKINLNTSHNVKCIAVIEELQNLSLSEVYLRDNIIGISQYDGTIPDTGLILDDDMIIPDSYDSDYDDSALINSYSIQYYNPDTTSIETVTGSSSPVIISKYGAHPLVIPETEIDTSNSADFRLLLYGKAAALFIGEQSLKKEQHLREKFSIKVSDEMQDKMHINDNMLLSFYPFVHEPVKITEHIYDADQGIIDITGRFLNRPVGVDLDISTPQLIPIISALGTTPNQLHIRWQLNSTAIGYQIQIRRKTQAAETFDVKYPFTENGIGEYYINCDNAVEYLIAVRCYNKKLLYSSWSREVSSITPSSTTLENKYRCKGDVSSGITLSMNNELLGIVPEDIPRSWVFGSAIYGMAKYSPAAIYESSIISVLNRVIIRAVGNLKYQYKHKNGDWNVLSMLDDNTVIDVTGEIQLRVMFLSQNWASKDTFYIIVE